MTKTVYLLQGLAHDTDNWDDVIQFLPPSICIKKIDVLKLGFIRETFSLKKASEELEKLVSKEPGVICGLSYGAVVAVMHAAMHPQSSHTYLLIGPQVRPPRLVTKILRIFGPLVYKEMEWHGGQKLNKNKVQSILKAYDSLDLKDELEKIQNETVVIIGKRDIPHYKPAKQILKWIENSRLVLIESAGHETNHSAPAELAHQIKRFSMKETKRKNG